MGGLSTGSRIGASGCSGRPASLDDMRKRGRWADHPELLLELSRNGIAKASALESSEMDSRTIYRRCLPGGPWRRLLPGVIQLSNHEATRDQRATAALLFAGPRAMLTGVEACLRHRLRASELPETDDVHVLVPHHRKLRSCEFVTVERTHRLPKPVFRNGFPLSPTVRAVIDAARRIREPDTVGQLLIEAIQRGRCSPQALSLEIETGSPRGTALPRRLLAEWQDLRSVAEGHAKQLSRKLRVAPSHWNPAIVRPDGSYLGRPDAWWEDVALAWEIDSVDFHFYKADYSRTLERNARYAAAGVVVVQTLPSRIETAPAAVLAELDAAYRAASARPRPVTHLAA